MTRKTGLVLLLGLAVALLGSPSLAAAQGDLAPFTSRWQVITSAIGDFDCFGYGAPTSLPANPMSPCGTLPDLPVADVSDPPNTDVVVECPPVPGATKSFTLTHTFEIPVGATVVAGVAVLNVGGIEKSVFPTTISADLVPALNVPDTGPLGTGLVIIPLTVTSLLQDGQVDVKIQHGGLTRCDSVFVDFSLVAVLVHLAS